MKTKTECRNIELKLSKTQISRNSGSRRAIITKLTPTVKKFAPKFLGMVDLSAVSGAVHGVPSKGVQVSETKIGGFGPLPGTMIDSLTMPLIHSFLVNC